MSSHQDDLFARDPSGEAAGPSKPFAQHVRETPAAPLPAWLKAALALAALVVAVLLILALMRLGGPRKPRPAPGAVSSGQPSAVLVAARLDEVSLAP